MPDSFEFTIPNPNVQLDAARTGRVVVDVTSRLGRHSVVGVEVRPGEGADPAWFKPLDPAEFDLPDGETLRTTVPIEVPAEAAAGDYQFTVRAFAVSEPQRDFTNSPSISMAVPEPKQNGGIPWWIFVVIGVVVLLIVGLVVFFVFGSDDDGDVPDLIGKSVPEAQADVGENIALSAFFEPGITEADGCVALQVPPAGAKSTSVAVFAVACPTPAPNVATPPVLENVCTASFRFCGEVANVFGADFASDPEWIAASAEMATAFVEAFRTEGDPVPTVVGTTESQALSTMSNENFLAPLVADGSGGPQCALLQHPYGGDLAAPGDLVTVVTTRCPAAANDADSVVLSTPITAQNICAQVPPFCASVDAGPRGPGYSTTVEFQADIAGQVQQFKNAFTGETVPAVTGLLLGAAQDELALKGLEAKFARPTQPSTGDGGFQLLLCWRVTGQNPASGTLISTLEDNDVVLALESEFCTFIFEALPFEVQNNVLVPRGG